MSEEEKKAIEYLKEYKDIVYKLPFKTILNLIDKQQKEIEELKKYIKKNAKENYFTGKEYYENKIREKIKEVSNGTYDAKIILEQLLEK